MRPNLSSLVILLSACIAGAAPAPYPIAVNSRAQSAPAVTCYRANSFTIRATYLDGQTASDLTGAIPFLSWATNTTAASVSTSSWAFVGSPTNGIVDFTFAPEAVNFTPGRYIYEVGVKTSNSVVSVYRQGLFFLVGSPTAAGVGAVDWTTSLNWDLIDWTNLPDYISAESDPVAYPVATNALAVAEGALQADATNYLASAVAHAQSAHGLTDNGGFAGGDSASAEGGGAVGASASAQYGGAVGYFASAQYGGAVGSSASALSGGAVGAYASALSGGAVGAYAYAQYGGAVGYEAMTSSGFAGGYKAMAALDNTGYGLPIDAIQLGTGWNPDANTLQVYSYKLMNADGSIPADRMATTLSGYATTGAVAAVAAGKVSTNHVGDVVVTGNVSATSFIGDGSQLSGIQVGDKVSTNHVGDVTITGNVSATSFIGDGSQLSGVSGGVEFPELIIYSSGATTSIPFTKDYKYYQVVITNTTDVSFDYSGLGDFTGSVLEYQVRLVLTNPLVDAVTLPAEGVSGIKYVGDIDISATQANTVQHLGMLMYSTNNVLLSHWYYAEP